MMRNERGFLVGGALTAAVIGAVAATLIAPVRPRLVWNGSASAPPGLYLVGDPGDVRRGDMVIAWLPSAHRKFAARRHYLPANVPLVKRVAAVSGDRVCARDRTITVNGRRVATGRERDGQGRPMPGWAGCVTLGEGALFLLMNAPDSFDGRYFGATARMQVIGKARLIWPR